MEQDTDGKTNNKLLRRSFYQGINST